MAGTEDGAIHWVAVGEGRLALWHRPGRKVIPRLEALGCDRVVTLLSAREGAEELGRAVEAESLAWTWIPLDGGRPPEGESNGPVAAALPALSAELDLGRSILVHCSAGMHRTGMVAYVLLRYRGLSEPAALERIAELRAHTRGALTPAHISWGNELIVTLGSRHA